jgi:hypothetical protein
LFPPDDLRTFVFNKERLKLPFACKAIELLVQLKIEQGFASLKDATNILQMIKEELEYAPNYYNYMVKEDSRINLDTIDKE